MWTQFGVKLRDLRSKRGMKLKDMAELLGIKPSYASGIETGKRNPSVNYVDSVADIFTEVDRADLHQLARESRTRVSVELAKESRSKQELAHAFARRFSSLTEDDVQKLLKDLNK